jgi:hypothetical protein
LDLLTNLPKKGRLYLVVTGNKNTGKKFKPGTRPNGLSAKKKSFHGFFRLNLEYRIVPGTHLYHHSVGGFLVETVAGTNPTQSKRNLGLVLQSIKKAFEKGNTE